MAEVAVLFFVIPHIFFAADFFCKFLCPDLFIVRRLDVGLDSLGTQERQIFFAFIPCIANDPFKCKGKIIFHLIQEWLQCHDIGWIWKNPCRYDKSGIYRMLNVVGRF